MKKLLFLITAFLFFFSTATIAERVTKNTETTLANDEFVEARAFADELEKRFGVRILISDECLDAIHPGAFSLAKGIPAGSPLKSILQGKGLMLQIEKVEKALSKYPVELFQYIKDNQAPNGLRILIADRIVDKAPDMWSVAYTTIEGSYYNIVLAHTYFEESSIHHEIWHAMEYNITAKYPGAFLIWNSLNPPGFRYSNEFTIYSSDFDSAYFAREYGTVNASEDRATIAEAVFYDNRDEWFAEHPAIKRKLAAMNLALKDTLIIQYNVKVE